MEGKDYKAGGSSSLTPSSTPITLSNIMTFSVEVRSEGWVSFCLSSSSSLPPLLPLFLLLLENVVDPREVFQRIMLDQLLLDRILAFDEHLTTLCHCF